MTSQEPVKVSVLGPVTRDSLLVVDCDGLEDWEIDKINGDLLRAFGDKAPLVMLVPGGVAKVSLLTRREALEMLLSYDRWVEAKPDR